MNARMDPQAALDSAESCLKSWVKSGDASDLSEAADFLANYAGWRRGGGFEPSRGDLRYERLAETLEDHKALARTEGTDDGWGEASDYVEGYDE